MLSQRHRPENRQMRIESLDLTAQRRERLGRRVIRSHNQRGQPCIGLSDRSKYEGLRRLAEAAIFAVPCDPYHLNWFIAAARNTEAFADGVGAGPEATRKGFVDDRDARRLVTVLLCEIASRDQTRAQRPKISGADLGSPGEWRFSLALRGTAFDVDWEDGDVQFERDQVPDSRRLRAGQRAGAFQQPPLKLPPTFAVVALQIQIEGELDGLLRIEAQFDVLHSPQSTKRQARADHQGE